MLEHQLILVLQADQAYWLKVLQGHITDHFEEAIPAEPGLLMTNCPWVQQALDGDTQIDVTLVLDTTMDEVDRVCVAQSGSAVINWYRQLTTLARLRVDYPKAHAYPLPPGYGDQIAALMHPDICEQWSSWLLLLQTSHVVFSKVATASELMANWSNACFVDTTLIVMDVAGFQRHLLVDRGSILFLRTVPTDKASGEDHPYSSCAGSRSAVAESIGHLSSVLPGQVGCIDVVSDFRVSAIDVEEGSVARSNDQLIGQPIGECTDPNTLGHGLQASCLPASISVLVALLFEQSLSYSDFVLRDEDVPSGRQLTEAPVKPCDKNGDKGWLLYKLESSGIRGSAVLWRRQRRWTLLRPGIGRMYALLPSIKHEKVCARIRVIFRLSVLMACTAAIGATAALASGIASSRLMGQQEQERTSLEQAVASAYNTVLDSFSQPRVAAESLIIADLLNKTAIASPEKILSELATAVNAVPDVSIDRIVWAMVKADDAYESLTHALASVPSIRTVESHAESWAVQVEMAGHVSGDTLVKRKAVLDTLLVELQTLRGAMGIVVLESPVDQALSSSTDRRHAGQYRLSLKMDH